MMTTKFTERGFGKIEFTDRYGVVCSLQESSLATEAAIWLGCNDADVRALIPGQGWSPVDMPQGVDVVANTRMHLTQEQVKELLPLLQHFVETGSLPVEGVVSDAVEPDAGTEINMVNISKAESGVSWELYAVLMEGHKSGLQYEIEVRATNVHHAKDVAEKEREGASAKAARLVPRK